jgi:hypothetical protein
MATYQSNTFTGQRMQLDGNEFDNNSFINCTLVYGGGPLVFRNNKLHGVRWEFVDAAARTLTLVASFYHGAGDGRQFALSLLEKFAQAPSTLAGVPAVANN